MKRKVRKPILILALLLLLVSVIFTVNLLSKSFSEPKELGFEKKQHYTYETYDNIAFNVDYTNDKSLNDALEDGIKEVFNDNLDIFKNKDKEIQVNLSLNSDKDLASWVFIEETDNLSEVFGTLVFNTTNNEIIHYDKIYDDNLKGLSMLVRSVLAKDDTLLYNKKTYTKTTPEIENFKYLTFNPNDVEILFKKDAFDTDEVKTAKFSYPEIMPYFSNDFLTFLDDAYIKPELFSERYIDPHKPMVAMTFDDGPNPGVSNDLGDYYAEKDSRVTYFWLGSRIETYPEIVLDLYNSGHEIANHSYNHKNYTKISDEELKKQTAYVTNLIKDITKQEKVLLRPPYGISNEAVRAKIDNPLILWQIDPEDWKHKEVVPIYNNIDHFISDGSIVLLHDLYPASVTAAKKILDDYSDIYQFVTVSEMFAYKGIPLNNGELYFGARGR